MTNPNTLLTWRRRGARVVAALGLTVVLSACSDFERPVFGEQEPPTDLATVASETFATDRRDAGALADAAIERGLDAYEAETGLNPGSVVISPEIARSALFDAAADGFGDIMMQPDRCVRIDVLTDGEGIDGFEFTGLPGDTDCERLD